MCVKIFIMNWYISKSYTATKNTIDRQYTEREKLFQLCQLLLMNNWQCLASTLNFLLSPSFQLMDASFARVHCHHHHLYSSLGGITLNFLHNIVLTTLFACFWAAVCFRVTCILIFLEETLCMAADRWMWADTFSSSFLGKFLFRCQTLCFLSRSSRRGFSHSTSS